MVASLKNTGNGENNIFLVIEDAPLSQTLQRAILNNGAANFQNNAHPTQDFFLSNQFDLSILDIQSTSFTHIVNTIITMLAEEDGTSFSPIIILSDGISPNRITDLADLIEVYVFRRDDPAQLLANQACSILRQRKELMQTKEQLNNARKIALLSMSASSQLGEVVRFHEVSYTAKGFQDLGKMLIDSFKLLGASCSGLFWVSNESHYFGDIEQKDHVLHVLNENRDRSRYVDVIDGTLIYFKNAWVYVTDMPAVNTEEYGQLKDSLFPLVEGAGQRAHTIQAEKNATLSQRSKAWFLTNVSHELRNPMGNILNSLYLLKKRNVGDLYTQRDVEVLNIIEGGANQLADLIEDLLTLSDIENISIVKQTFSISSAIEPTTTLLERWANNKGITFNVTLEPKEFFVFSDPKFVKQLLRSLISNAVKYTDKGGIDISIRQLGDESFPELQIIVKDTGRGFDVAQVRKFMKPFSELDEKALQSGQGTGLGLSVVVQLLSQLDGSLDIESELDQGSAFTLTIPVHAPDNADNLLF